MEKQMTLFSLRLVVVAVISIFATQAFSQDFKMGLNFGCNYTALSFDKKAYLVWDVERKFSPRVGLIALYDSGSRFSFNSTIVYDRREGQFSTLGAADGLAIVTERYHYLTLSPKLQYNSKWGFFFNAGPAAGVKLKAERVRREIDLFDFAPYKTEIEHAKDVRLGFIAGVGYEITIAGIALAPEISYDFGLRHLNGRSHSKFSSLLFGTSVFF